MGLSIDVPTYILPQISGRRMYILYYANAPSFGQSNLQDFSRATAAWVGLVKKAVLYVDKYYDLLQNNS